MVSASSVCLFLKSWFLPPFWGTGRIVVFLWLLLLIFVLLCHFFTSRHLPPFWGPGRAGNGNWQRD